jgi:uncharacterized phage protein gp47/JayE
MSDFGLTPEGFVIKRQEDIIADIVSDEKDTFGEQIDTEASSGFGQLNGVLSKPLIDLWEQMAAVYNAMKQTASGVALDDYVAYNGIKRKAATKAYVDSASVIGVLGTTVPAGSRASLVYAGTRIFESVTERTIALNLLNFLTVTPKEGLTDYQMTINGILVSTSYGSPPPIGAVMSDFANAINSTVEINTRVFATVNDASLLQITAKSGGSGFSLSFYSLSFDLNETGSPVDFQAIETGVIVVLPEVLNTIVTAVDGWERVTNILNGSSGTAAETDAALRVRRSQLFVSGGNASVEAIRAKILNNVADVSMCIVNENPLDTTSGDGLPPHSFEAIVAGGTDSDVAKQIFETKGAGIQTYGAGAGAVTQTVVDSQGIPHTINFTRPINKYAHVKIVYVKTAEETFPPSGEQLMAAAILAYGQTLLAGNDLLWQRFLTPVVSISGVKSATISLAVTTASGDTPSYVDNTNIAIPQRNVAVFDITRIHVSL